MASTSGGGKSEGTSGEETGGSAVTVQLERSVAESLLVALTRALGGPQPKSGRQ
ncbi:MAG TPA: hypothetical protein VHC97_13730 [Thermoanaerobaculia bacterium]|nr:hypothetical protein [Thermoanaerobaculia bacterium]